MNTGTTTASASPLHQCLRQASKPAHYALDHHPLLAALAVFDAIKAHLDGARAVAPDVEQKASTH
jgi:hypothetical protein